MAALVCDKRRVGRGRCQQHAAAMADGQPTGASAAPTLPSRHSWMLRLQCLVDGAGLLDTPQKSERRPRYLQLGDGCAEGAV